MSYAKVAFLALLTGFVTLVAAGSFQVWLTGLMLERELHTKIDARLSRGDVAGVDSAGGDVNMLPAFGLALVAFLAMFVWRLRAGRAPSREPRAPR